MGHTLVDPDLAVRLTRASRATVGDELRSVTYFTPTDHEQVYRRSDLDGAADLSGFVAQESDGFRAREYYTGTELGDYRYTVRSFGRGYLVRTSTESEGAFVTVDTITLRRAEELAEALVGIFGSAERARVEA